MFPGVDPDALAGGGEEAAAFARKTQQAVERRMAAAQQGVEDARHEGGGAQLRGIRKIPAAGAQDVAVGARADAFLGAGDEMAGVLAAEK